MNDKDTISLKAVTYALDAHADQTDKAGRPYSEHLWGVAKLAPERLMVVALAHDVMEDTGASEYDLKEHEFDDEEIELIHLLTLEKGKRRDDYLRAIRRNPDAACVKIADVLNNVSRLHQIEDEETRDRLLLKYQRTLEVLVNGY